MSENILFLYEIKVTICEQNFTADIFRTLAKKLCVDDFNILLLVETEIMQATDHDHFLIENEASFIKQDQNHIMHCNYTEIEMEHPTPTIWYQ